MLIDKKETAPSCVGAEMEKAQILTCAGNPAPAVKKSKRFFATFEGAL